MLKVCCYVLFILLITSCDVAVEKQNVVGKTVFRYNEPGGISWLDPAKVSKLEDFLVSQHIFNGLVMLDKEMNIQPSIASSWEVSPDGLIYTFKLKKDVKFHSSPLLNKDQLTVNSEDVIFSFNRIIDPQTASPGKYIFQNVINSGEGIRAIDESTIQIRLIKPQPSFLFQLCLPYGSILPSEVVDHYGTDFSQNVIGTGPFMLRSWKKDVKLILSRNPKYFEYDTLGVRLPYLDAVSITFLSDRHQEFIKFNMGKLDMISGLNEDDKDILLTADGKLKHEMDERFYMIKKPWLNTDYLGILLDDSINNIIDNPLKHQKLRSAIGYSIDRRNLVKFLRNSIGIPAEQGFIPNGMPDFDKFKIDGFNFDKDRSLRLLAEAGFINGKDKPIITLLATEPYKTMCEFLQKQFEDIGLDVRIDIQVGSALSQRILQFEAKFYRKSWVADFPEAINYLQLFYSGNFFPENGYNYTHFKNERYDKIYERALTEQDQDIRYSLYKQMQQIIHEQVPVIPLFYGETLRFYNRSVNGIESNYLNQLSLKKVKIKN